MIRSMFFSQTAAALVSCVLFATVTLSRAQTIDINAAVTGRGVILGNGAYESGAPVTLRAVPQVDWQFDHWEGVPVEKVHDNPITLTAASGLNPSAVMTASSGAGRFAGAPLVIEGNITPPAGLGDVVSVSAGPIAAAVLKNDGTVVPFGSNTYKQSDLPAGLDDVVAIDVGVSHTLAVLKDGRVLAWGQNNRGQTNVPHTLTNAYAVAAGSGFSLALKQDGLVVAWGANNLGQCDIPAGLRDVVAIAAGDAMGLALKADGKLVAWGRHLYPNGNYLVPVIPASFTDLIAVSASYNYILGLKRDGAVVDWGFAEGDSTSPKPPGLPPARWIAAGWTGGLAVDFGNTLNWFRETLPETHTGQMPNILTADSGEHFIVAIENSGSGFIFGDRSEIFVEELQPFRLAPEIAGGQTFQWFRNGQPIGTATSRRLEIASTQTTDAGDYQLAVTDGSNAFATPPTKVRVVPAGYPRVLVNGSEVRTTARLDAPAQITLTTTLANPQIFYTLDGSTPTFSSTPYAGPFTLTAENTAIRALAINGDLTKQAFNDPVLVQVLPTYTITVNISGPGRVELAPELTSYLKGDVVRVEAIPNANATFVRWANMLSGFDPVREITMNSNWTIEAVFEDSPRYSATIIAPPGTVSVNPSTPQYAGADVTITANPTAWNFKGWTGDHTTTERSFIWHVAGPATFTANHDTTIAATSNGPGHIELQPNLPRYDYGAEVEIIPAPDFGNQLVLWGLDGAGKPLTPWTLTVDKPEPKISALFGPLNTPAYQITEQRVENNQLKFRITGTTGTTIVVQSTTDFAVWADGEIVTFQNAGGIEQSIPIQPADTQRFMRIKQTPPP